MTLAKVFNFLSLQLKIIASESVSSCEVSLLIYVGHLEQASHIVTSVEYFLERLTNSGREN